MLRQPTLAPLLPIQVGQPVNQTALSQEQLLRLLRLVAQTVLRCFRKLVHALHIGNVQPGAHALRANRPKTALIQIVAVSQQTSPQQLNLAHQILPPRFAIGNVWSGALALIIRRIGHALIRKIVVVRPSQASIVALKIGLATHGARALTGDKLKSART